MIEFLSSSNAISIPPTPLLGRNDELAAARRLLRDPRVRLVTLLGPGGVGKTRLALELALRLEIAHPGGVSLVSLEMVRDANLVPAAITRQCGVGVPGARPPRTPAPETESGRDHLLVVDNFEHLLAAAPVVSELLGSNAGLKLLVTSREPLHLRGEHRLVVPPLALPAERGPHNGAPLPVATLVASPAVALFVERARAARRDFAIDETNAAVVAAICARLDGLPLAIELAAARVDHLSPTAILERIDRRRAARLSLLDGGPRDAPARLRTMRDAIAWSHDLLAARERLLFRRLAVLDAGFTVEAAAAVCAAGEWETIDGIRALLDKSLLGAAYGPAGEPRFSMLQTVRAFAWERLAVSGEEAAVRHLHAAWLLSQGEPPAATPEAEIAPQSAMPRAEQAGTRGDAAASLAAAERPCLTPREWEVLRLLAQGLCDKEIATLLEIRAQTATKHVGNLLHKLGVHSRTAAATLAVRRGYV